MTKKTEQFHKTTTTTTKNTANQRQQQQQHHKISLYDKYSRNKYKTWSEMETRYECAHRRKRTTTAPFSAKIDSVCETELMHCHTAAHIKYNIKIITSFHWNGACTNCTIRHSFWAHYLNFILSQHIKVNKIRNEIRTMKMRCNFCLASLSLSLFWYKCNVGRLRT